MRPGVFARPASAIVALVAFALAGCGNLPAPAPQQSLIPSPVAFVTAGPLPRATPTATLAPVAAPTSPPPTSAPKTFPVDTSATVGVWSDRVGRNFTGTVDLAAGPDAIELRKANLRLVTLASQQVYSGFARIISETRAANPGYLLYDKDGKVALAPGGDAAVLNIRNADVRAQIADRVAVAARGFDGVILDGVGDELIRASASPIFTTTKAFTDQQRRDAVDVLLRAIRARVPDKLLIVSGYAWEDGAAFSARPTEAQDLAAIADGAYVEKFLRAPISRTNEFKSEANWKKDVDLLANLSQDNKVVLLSTRFSEPISGTQKAEWLRYVVTSYLLGKNGTRTYLQFDSGGDMTYLDDPLLNTRLGAPVEGYGKLASGLYKREFASGVVLVNPGEKAIKIDIAADLKAAYETLSGLQVKSLEMSPRSGTILLKKSP
ncbi:MAG: hypothetical protein KA750_02360 [Thermoflexales bacterium]|nr:hypothetical protein [Thermoflexales bacterium]